MKNNRLPKWAKDASKLAPEQGSGAPRRRPASWPSATKRKAVVKMLASPAAKKKSAAKEKAPYMPFYGREFFSDVNVMAMTPEQQAYYIKLLWLCWQDGSIPGDTTKLAAICDRMVPARFESDIWPALRGCFTPSSDGTLIHRKVEAVRAEKDAFRDKRSAAGKLGNEKRWASQEDRKTVANVSQQDHKTIASDLRSPNTEDTTKNICAPTGAPMSDSAPAVSIDNPPFDTTEPDALFTGGESASKNERRKLEAQQDLWFADWWASYWLKKSRKRAREAFGRHVRSGARFRQVMEATRTQSAEMLSREAQHRPHGATWLNGERWDDETATPAAPKPETAGDTLARMIYGDAK